MVERSCETCFFFDRDRCERGKNAVTYLVNGNCPEHQQELAALAIGGDKKRDNNNGEDNRGKKKK